MPRRSAPSRTPSTTSTSTELSKPRQAPHREASEALAARLGLVFSDPSLLDEALVHSSYPNEHPEGERISNERLEFLGDAVIALVISEAVYARHPGDDEGVLTARRAAIVSTQGLARLARRIDLGPDILLGQGADRSHARNRDSVLASAFEAVTAAVYLDQGLGRVRGWLLDLAELDLTANADASRLVAPKSRLQAFAYARDGHAPSYRVVSAEGPDHAKHYVVEAFVAGDLVGRGEGRNRREAETNAALAGLALLAPEVVPDPGPDA